MAFQHDSFWEVEQLAPAAIASADASPQSNARQYLGQPYRFFTVLLRLALAPMLLTTMYRLPVPFRVIESLLVLSWAYAVYLMVVEPRLRRYVLYCEEKGEAKRMTRPFFRRALYGIASKDSAFFEILMQGKRSIGGVVERLPYLFYLDLGPFWLGIYATRAYPPEESYQHWILLALAFLPAGAFCLIVRQRFRRQMSCHVEGGDLVTVGKTESRVALAAVDDVQYCWDSVLYRDYLEVWAEGRKYFLYNDKSDPMYLIRIAKLHMAHLELCL